MGINKIKMIIEDQDMSDWELGRFKKDSVRRVDIYGNKVYTHYNEELMPIYKKYGKWNGRCWDVEDIDGLLEELGKQDETLYINYYFYDNDHE
jgi:hypothetical protein